MRQHPFHLRLLAASLALCLGLPGRALALRATEAMETPTRANLETQLAGAEETPAQAFVREQYAPLGEQDPARLAAIRQQLDQLGTLEFSPAYSPLLQEILREIVVREMLRLKE